jgi:pimeloyl-ACP methyl ester carboxylesterase
MARCSPRQSDAQPHVHGNGESPIPKPLLFHRVFFKSAPAPWVVFVHGAGGSSSIWFKQVRAFRREFNVVLLDLRGHGRSRDLFQQWCGPRGYTFKEVCEDIVRVLDHLHIPRAHFVGISLGTILIRVLAEEFPERVSSMIMGGAIIGLNLRSRMMLWVAGVIKRLVPFMWLYRLYAWILIPHRRHAESRNLFIREAKKLYQREFIRWVKGASHVIPLMRYFRERELSIPVLYIMGDEDYMFLPPVILLAGQHQNARLHVVPSSGHVCNVDQPEAFNSISIEFIKSAA